MNYELAKELKDAGYPQELRRGTYYNPQDYQVCIDAGITKENVYIPNLSELINACGDDFFALHKTKTGWEASTKTGTSGDWKLSKAYSGSTPEEAVARLWLALNKK